MGCLYAVWYSFESCLDILFTHLSSLQRLKEKSRKKARATKGQKETYGTKGSLVVTDPATGLALDWLIERRADGIPSFPVGMTVGEMISCRPSLYRMFLACTWHPMS